MVVEQRTFRSKVDWWLGAALLMPAIGSVAALVAIGATKAGFLGELAKRAPAIVGG
jgi:hypothetical protein